MDPLAHIAERLVRDGPALVLSGAGLSTDSGIPDYRGPGTMARARKPIQFKQFLASEVGRQRYWARSSVGWPRIEAALPNPAHMALATLEEEGSITGVITQNVDRLHHKAGSKRVVELHGALAEVRCLDCGARSGRAEFQERLRAANSQWHAQGHSAPDGDVDLDDHMLQDFIVPGCTGCGGPIKPDVVFFGESVPRQTVEEAWQLFATAKALLVVGTSLTVYSGFRFVRRAAEAKLPIFILNQSETRGDALATALCREPLGASLPGLLRYVLREDKPVNLAISATSSDGFKGLAKKD